METTSAAPAAPPPRPFRLVPSLFFRPRRTFSEVIGRGRPSWVTPILVLSLSALLPVLALGRVRQQTGAAGEQSLPPDFQYYTPQQQAQFMQAMQSTQSPTFVYVLPAVGAVAVVWLGWLITGSVLHLASTLLGGRSTSMAVLNVTAWAGLPLALRSAVRAGFILLAGRGLAAPGLAGFVPSEVTGLALFGRQLLGAVDVYLIWHIVLLGLGLSALGGLSRGKVALSVALTEIVALLLLAIPGAIAASLAGLTIIRPFLF
jgi:hypothetical protein